MEKYKIIEEIKKLKALTGATHQELADSCGAKVKEQIKLFLRHGSGLSGEKSQTILNYLRKKVGECVTSNDVPASEIYKTKQFADYTPEVIAENFGIDMKNFNLKGVKVNKRTVTKKDGEVITEMSCSPRFERNAEEPLPGNFFENLNKKLNKLNIENSISEVKKQAEKAITVIPLYDIHIGKIDYKGKEDPNYCSDLLKAINNLIDRTNKFEELHLIFDGDFVNIANKQGTTNAGTPQSTMPWFEVIDKSLSFSVSALANAIAKARSHGGKVVVHLVDGNHAHMPTYQTLKAVELAYHNYIEEGIIEFRIEPYKRAYLKYNNVFLAFSHGDKEGKRIFETVISEKPIEYGTSKYRAIFTGHFHTSKMEEAYKIHHFAVGSPAIKDTFHNDYGYVGSSRKIEAFEFGEDNMRAHYYEFI